MEPASEKRNDHLLKNIVFGMVGVFVAVLIFIVGLTVGVAASTGFNFNGVLPASDAGSSASLEPSTTMTNSGSLSVSLMNDVLQRLRSQWYGQLPSNDQLTDGALRGMVSSLGDPFTSYVEPKYAQILNQDMTSKFEGIGAT